MTRVCVHAHMLMYMHARTHVPAYTHTVPYMSRRDDELDRVIVPLATGGVVETIKACVPGVKTCKDALYKVPARRHHSAAPLPPFLPPCPPISLDPPPPGPLREMRHSSTREHRSPTATLYTHTHPLFPRPFFRASAATFPERFARNLGKRAFPFHTEPSFSPSLANTSRSGPGFD